MMRKTTVLATAILLTGALWQSGQTQEENRAGLIVDFGNGTVYTNCITFTTPEISGYELLKSSGLAIIDHFDPGFGAAICTIDNVGCPSESCLVCDPQSRYWSYWHRSATGWNYSPAGSSNYTVGNGDVEGWSWGMAAPPSTALTFEQICPLAGSAPTASPTPTVTFTATPTKTNTPPASPTKTLTPTAAEIINQSGQETPTSTPVAINTATFTPAASSSYSQKASTAPIPLLSPTAQPITTAGSQAGGIQQCFLPILLASRSQKNISDPPTPTSKRPPAATKTHQATPTEVLPTPILETAIASLQPTALPDMPNDSRRRIAPYLIFIALLGGLVISLLVVRRRR